MIALVAVVKSLNDAADNNICPLETHGARFMYGSRRMLALSHWEKTHVHQF